MPTDSYKTISGHAEGLYKDKGSKFLAFAEPVCSVEEVKALLDKYKKDYYDARHVCYAYKILMSANPLLEPKAADNEIYRANDDGEPSGTAGRPILGQITSKGVTNVLVVVVRYFGGILLGTGGLIVAYKEATQDALNNATIVETDILVKRELKFPYEKMNDIMKLIRDCDARITGQNYEDNLCVMNIEVKRAKAALFKIN